MLDLCCSHNVRHWFWHAYKTAGRCMEFCSLIFFSKQEDKDSEWVLFYFNFFMNDAVLICCHAQIICHILKHSLHVFVFWQSHAFCCWDMTMYVLCFVFTCRPSSLLMCDKALCCYFCFFHIWS
jgi:hypothetical protein